MQIKRIITLTALTVVLSNTIFSQVGIGTITPHASAELEVNSTNKGFLPPRVALTSTNSASPLSSFAAGMLVYNTATAGTVPNNVIPGTYISNGTAWIRVANAADASKWTNNPTNTRVELSALSDGTTARSASESVAITDVGNLGIGTTAPTTNLHIYKITGSSSGTDAGGLTLQTDNPIVGQVSQKANLKLIKKQVSGAVQWNNGLLYQGYTQNAGVNSAIGSFNEINSFLSVTKSSLYLSARSGMTDNDPTTGTLNTVLTVDGGGTSTGAVGIGTVSPNYKLSLGSDLGNTKLAIYDGSSTIAYGIGAQSGQFRFHTNTSTDRFKFLNAPNGTELMTILGTGNVGIGTTGDPNSTAQLEVKSTTKGFLPPRMTHGQRNAISNPAQGLIVYCTDCGGSGQAQVYDGATWTNMIGEAAFPLFVCGTYTVTAAGYTYGTVLSAGKCWLDRNIGATQVAVSSADMNAYGAKFQWGRGADLHQKITYPNIISGVGVYGTTTNLSSTDSPGNPNFILAPNAPYDWRSGQNNNLWQGISGINNPCPSGFRLPTQTELNNERLSWSSNNQLGAWYSPLKLTMAGYRNGTSASVDFVGTSGFYWSSTINGTGSYYLDFNTPTAIIPSGPRAHGMSVRCIKD